MLVPQVRLAFPMPTTREHSSCLEASRATALAAHSAAGLAAAAGLREAARLLRSCEALARAATAALLSVPSSASLVHQVAGATVGQATVVSADAPAAQGAGRRKKKKKKKNGNVSEDMVVDGNLVAVGGSAAVQAPAVAAFQMSPHVPAFVPGAAAASARVLEKKPSRERSPRREASPAPPSSSLASPPSLSVPADAGKGGFSEGQAALLYGLVSRTELDGCRVTLRSFDAASSRWAVALDTSGESIRVKAYNLRPSIFMPGAFGTGAHS